MEQYLITQIAKREINKRKNKPTKKKEAKKKKEAREEVRPFPQKYLCVDQSPIGRSPRSTPASYCDIMNPIREVFAQTKLSRQRGYKIGRFSFNASTGRCEYCEGKGSTLIEMHFLSDVWLECESCQGARYNQATLEVKFNGKNIAEVLEMSVEEAIISCKSTKDITQTHGSSGTGSGLYSVGATCKSNWRRSTAIKLAKELKDQIKNCAFIR